MASKSGLAVVVDHFKQVSEAISLLADMRVMVGVPDTGAGRREGEISNASLAYIHENGAPEANIPARPFLKPGIKNAHRDIVASLKKAGQFALAGKPQAVDRQLHRTGMIGRDAVKRKITEGPFVPLKQATIDARRKRSKGSRYRRKATTAVDVKPLIDTGQMRNAISYVIRKAKKR